MHSKMIRLPDVVSSLLLSPCGLVSGFVLSPCGLSVVSTSGLPWLPKCGLPGSRGLLLDRLDRIRPIRPARPFRHIGSNRIC